MEALKVIGLCILVFLGFGILAGISLAAKAVGFVVGCILFGVVIVGLFLYWIVHAVKKPKTS